MNRAQHRALLLAAVLLVGACTPIGKMSHDMDNAIRSASTKADHETLAAHYEEEAKALQAKAVKHEDLAKAYTQLSQSDVTRNSADMAKHCATLASTYRQAAAENLALAKEHHESAAAAPK